MIKYFVLIILILTITFFKVETVNALNENADDISEEVKETRTVQNAEEEDSSTEDMRSASEDDKINVNEDGIEMRNAEETDFESKSSAPNTGRSEIITTSKSEKRSVDTQIEKSIIEMPDMDLKNADDTEDDDADESYVSFKTSEKSLAKDLDEVESRADHNIEIMNTEDKEANDDIDSFNDDLDEIPLNRNDAKYDTTILEMKARKHDKNINDEVGERAVAVPNIHKPAPKNIIGTNHVNRLPYKYIPNMNPSLRQIQNSYLYSPMASPLMPVNNRYAKNQPSTLGDSPLLRNVNSKNLEPYSQMVGRSGEAEEYKTIDDFSTKQHDNAYPYSPVAPQFNSRLPDTMSHTSSEEPAIKSINSKLRQASVQPQYIGMNRGQYGVPYNYNINPIFSIPPLNVLQNARFWRP